MHRLAHHAFRILLVVLGAVVLATGLGLLLPRHHVARTRVVLQHPVEQVWAIIDDLPSQPDWRSDLQGVERVADPAGREIWLQHTDRGDWAIELTTREAPRLLVTTTADSSDGFGGTWTYEVAAVDSGTALTITEHGFIDSPLYRFLARFVFGLHGTQEVYLRDLADHLDEDARLERLD